MIVSNPAVLLHMASTRKQTRRKKEIQPDNRKPLSEVERQELKEFVYFSLGEERLSVWEANFVNHIKQLIHFDKVFISEKQWRVIGEIKEKLHYDRPDDPLPYIDTDGIEENIDEDGFVIRSQITRFENDQEFVDSFFMA